MLSRYLRRAALAVALFDFASAQGASKIVPSDLSKIFSSSGQNVQVSYTNKAVDGFVDGTTFDKNAVTKEPTFALGDSDSIVPTRRYTIVMIDTTCDNARTLHYARANFKWTDVVNIVSESDASVAYKAPGSNGETGDDRKYSFLMYQQTSSSDISSLKVSTTDASFDAQKFQTDNGLKDPVAGVGMVVKLGGQSSCNGNAQASQGAGAPESSSSSAAAALPAPSAPSIASSAAVAPSSAASRASSAASRVASAASSALSTAFVPAASTAGASQVSVGESANPSTRTAGRSGATNGVGAASTVFIGVEPNPTGTASRGNLTATGQPALQTTSGASGLSFGRAGYLMASLAVLVTMVA